MAKSYLITGPLHVANKKPGDTVTSDELTDAGHLLSIGYIQVVKASSTKTLRVVEGDALESLHESTPTDSDSTSQEETF